MFPNSRVFNVPSCLFVEQAEPGVPDLRIDRASSSEIVLFVNEFFRGATCSMQAASPSLHYQPILELFP